MNLVLGGGLTGITAAYALHKRRIEATVLEADAEAGGASRTLTHPGGYRFDLGGHRLYTRLADVLDLVRDLIGDDLLEVERLSRIYLNGRFTDYPLSFRSTWTSLGPAVSLGVAASYLAQRAKGVFGGGEDRTFEDWVTRRFGRRLHSIYFAPYTEKLWGVPCDRLSADFATQRIRGLSMRAAVKSMFFRGGGPATLTSRFWYPRLGFGRIHETMIERMPAGSVRARAPVTEVRHDGRRIGGVTAGGESWSADRCVLTFPVSEFVRMLRPEAPPLVLAAADALKFRDLIVCFLTLDRPQVTPDHWLYIPSPDICFSRLHEPKNWSAAMAPPDRTGIVAEIFCQADDPVWREDDGAIARKVALGLERTGLIDAREVLDSRVVRLRRMYPIYDLGYADRLNAIKSYLRNFENLICAGRQGTFRYTSGDYCMAMGLRAAENVLGAGHDLFRIGSESEYAEE